MAKDEGWVVLHRSIKSNWVWKDKPFSKGQAWIDLILRANHADKKVIFDTEVIIVPRGSFITSEVKLSEDWGWSREKVRNFLKTLVNDEMITKKADNRKTTVTIVNYDVLQHAPTTGKQLGNNSETTGKQLGNTNNNYNNYNNEKTNNTTSPASSWDELSAEEKRRVHKELSE